VVGGKSTPDVAIKAAATKANQILKDAE
jgi:hypothetical protein